MVIVGFAGHRYLTLDDAWPWVHSAMLQVLDDLTDPLSAVLGLTCLAEGADQLFAQTVLRVGGRLGVVIPFPGFANTLKNPVVRDNYEALFGQRAFSAMMRPQPTLDLSYVLAGERVVQWSDLLVAVWNNLPSRGPGGTAQVVAYALGQGKHVVHIDPERHEIERLTV